MHDTIFENQNNLDTKSLIEHAKRIDLDIQQFEEDLKNDKLEKKVDADFESGLRSGVNGTPTFFINGERYNGNWEEDPISDYLEAKIKWGKENEMPLL
jgi:protein-disulfide isomerase